MMTTFQDVLAALRAIAPDERAKGKYFERLIQQYLLVDPEYANRLETVWMWDDFPYRWEGGDIGVDLVAREQDTGEYWAIQAKFYAQDHQIDMQHLERFIATSSKMFETETGTTRFSQKLLVATTDKWGKNAEKLIAGQFPPVIRLFFEELANSPVDWSRFELPHPERITLKKKKDLRDDQKEAIQLTKDGFSAYDRGKLIMACGTGKTFTSLRLMEQIVPDNGIVLFLAPSISLVSQTLRAWTADALDPQHTFVVCSDVKVGKDEEDLRLEDLGYPATTDPHKLLGAIQKASKGRRTIIFCTYQSIQVVIDAQKAGLGTLDLIICDEAHRTTGLTLATDKDDSEFVKVHHNHLIRANKRLYMTATPRIFADASKGKAQAANATLYSMDDEDTYGPEFYRMGFGKAVDQDLLTEYKVLIVAVDEERMAKLANAYNNAYKIDDKKAVDINFAAKIIGSWKGLSKQGLLADDGQEEVLSNDPDPMRRAVAFSRSINGSKQMIEVFDRLVAIYQEHQEVGEEGLMVHCDLKHVDGTMNAMIRQKSLDWLKAQPGEDHCRILSNARCLSEGVDVPALDAVVFFDTRESMVDIVQSVGRVMRKVDGKKFGYIILPVCIPMSQVSDYNNYVDKDAQFKGIWKVIKALRAHDESLVDEAEFRRKIKVITGDGGTKKDRDGNNTENLPLDFPDLPLEQISQAVYAIIPKKLGDREYWADWAKDIAKIAGRLELRFRDLLRQPEARAAFEKYLSGLQMTLNPAIDENSAIEMLVQHILTRPVFDALFEGYAFTEENPVSRSLQAVLAVVDDHALDSETEGLDKFYQSIRDRVSVAKSEKSRQDLIRNLYDTFFQTAFPRMAARLGIVYTPVEVVDFILHSADYALKKHFGTSISAPGVRVLDPFTGTGTFMTRLLQSGLIAPEDLERKYKEEMYANEIVLLAYYIAALNIESTYHAITGKYEPFPGIVLTDTFQMDEVRDGVDDIILPENNERVEHEKQQEIRVIFGNPPYSIGQTSGNDNNKNNSYPRLDGRIRETYSAVSSSKLIRNLYASEIRALRWATDRIGNSGVVTFITNGRFINSNNGSGLRKSIEKEFKYAYVLNLRGFIKGRIGEDAKREGQGIFDIVTGTAIIVLIKLEKDDEPCELLYYDIGDYLSRENKLGLLSKFTDISGLKFTKIESNDSGDWAEQRSEGFDHLVPLGSKEKGQDETIFSIYSLGVVTNRDAWVYSFSKNDLEYNMRRMIKYYNQETASYQKASKGFSKDNKPDVDDIVDSNPKYISWTRGLKTDAKNGKKYSLQHQAIAIGQYRPFTKLAMYFNGQFNEMVLQIPKLFPTTGHKNIVISVTGIGARRTFSTLATDCVPNLHLHDTGQCFPLYWYEKVSGAKPGEVRQASILDDEPPADQDGYIRHDAITDWSLKAFREQYKDTHITKEDIFWYVYGILHSPEYCTHFANDLKKMLPRIPYAPDFWVFSKAGCELSRWHLNYENVEPWPLTEALHGTIEDYRVVKMRFGKNEYGKADKTVIRYNDYLSLTGIPLEAYEYVVNGRPAIEWIMDRYEVTTDKASGIVNDPNKWADEHGEPRYIVDLIKRVVKVSVETVRIVKGLPSPFCTDESIAEKLDGFSFDGFILGKLEEGGLSLEPEARLVLDTIFKKANETVLALYHENAEQISKNELIKKSKAAALDFSNAMLIFVARNVINHLGRNRKIDQSRILGLSDPISFIQNIQTNSITCGLIKEVLENICPMWPFCE
jgi:predicted helicase